MVRSMSALDEGQDGLATVLVLGLHATYENGC